MKKIIGLVLLAAIAAYLYRRYLDAKRDPLREHLQEQQALREVGYAKQDITLREQIPIMSVGELPFAGVAQTIFNAFGGQANPKPLRLQPKGVYDNPFDSIITWN